MIVNFSLDTSKPDDLRVLLAMTTALGGGLDTVTARIGDVSLSGPSHIVLPVTGEAQETAAELTSVPLPPAPSDDDETASGGTQPQAGDLDDLGRPYDPAVHTPKGTKNTSDGSWRFKRGTPDDAKKAYLDRVSAPQVVGQAQNSAAAGELVEIKTTPETGQPVPPPPAPVEAAVPPPPAAPTPAAPAPTDHSAFVTMMRKVADRAKELGLAGTPDWTGRMNSLAKQVGLEGMAQLHSNQDKIPAFEALLDAVQ